jgi:ferric-dicitrate binding protein FerR (iron transport regulator)
MEVMRIHSMLAALALGLGLAALLATPSPAREGAGKIDSAQIAKLIDQLGSDEFEVREKATAALEAIGEPAVEALRAAVQKTDDVDIRLRAGMALSKIEKRLESVKALAGKKVHLVYKDAPLAEAVEDLKKKSGYDVVLSDPDGKLKDRTITLDTGEVTFWQALDQVCAKAGLKEGQAKVAVAAPQPADTLPPPPPPGKPVPPIRRGGVNLPAPAEKDVKEEAAPVKTEKKEEAKAAEKKEKADADEKDAEAQKKAAAEEQARAVAQKARAIQRAQAAAPPVAVQPVPLPPNPGGGPIGVPMNPQPTAPAPEQIVLVDGKADTVPTDASSAVRVRAVTKAEGVAACPKDEYQVVLEMTVEPKLLWKTVEKVSVAKAIDNMDQKLAQATADVNPTETVVDAPTPGNGVPADQPAPPVRVRPGGRPIPLPVQPPQPPAVVFQNGGVTQTAILRVKKGEKDAKSLKELSGSVNAELWAEPTAIITAPEILKAAGKTFKGGQNGQLVIKDVTKNDNGQIDVRLELTAPADVMPVGGPAAGAVMPGGPFPINGGPVPPGVKLGFGAAGGAAVAQPGVIIGGGRGPFIQPGAGAGASPAGLSLLDDKGNAFDQGNVVPEQINDQNGFRFQWVVSYTPKKGQGDATKLIFMGRKSLSVEVPFTLKDVTLP